MWRQLALLSDAYADNDDGDDDGDDDECLSRTTMVMIIVIINTTTNDMYLRRGYQTVCGIALHAVTLS